VKRKPILGAVEIVLGLVILGLIVAIALHQGGAA